MADKSKIEWTEATWNPIRARNRETGGVGHFCVHASPGCANCYAERLQVRFHNPVRFAAQDAEKVEVFLDEGVLTQPLRWKKPRMIFVCSMTDLFGEFVTDAMLDRVFAVMALCPQHTFQVLTKRSERMREWFGSEQRQWEACESVFYAQAEFAHVNAAAKEIACNETWGSFKKRWPLRNVWLGVSVEDQRRADERIPDLDKTPAAVRWLSCEPLLSALRLGGESLATIDWVVVGGESGPKARPMHPDWARSLRDQCAGAGVPFFFKQWGEYGPDVGPSEERDREGYRKDPVMAGAGPCQVLVDGAWRTFDDGYAVPIELCSGHGEFVYRLGKKRNGRLLDGKLHDAMPSCAEGLA